MLFKWFCSGNLSFFHRGCLTNEADWSLTNIHTDSSSVFLQDIKYIMGFLGVSLSLLNNINNFQQQVFPTSFSSIEVIHVCTLNNFW